ncbi:alpha/beta fold hydrolase [Streptomyces alkaliphilus]|uniref:Alpha/beta fold hydrolase n=1 Tax=Streptomyces alkaliphilus TaxID=1472722 RepID=A0A7W3Y127_9ACTN|nr:alpha/beta hydrolase [Streptomyces alkaliphilus]MBB0243896.1 alpha/beta fold hydrolase [Streptomyces alkaliphilus]
MANFVLVPGAWLGARAWEEVAAELRAAGHDVHPLTLSGLAEKRHLPAGRRTHVRDVVEEVERLGPGEVVLVGHSYSGIPVGQAAALIGDRLARLVCVDSNVPVDGESFVSAWPEGRAMVEAAIADNDGWWPPPPAEEYAGQGLSDEQVGRIVAGATPHPGASLTEPAELARPLAELPATYIKCLLDGEVPPPEVAELVKGGHWRLVTMDTGHWPMFSRPRELARVLLEGAPA